RTTRCNASTASGGRPRRRQRARLRSRILDESLGSPRPSTWYAGARRAVTARGRSAWGRASERAPCTPQPCRRKPENSAFFRWGFLAGGGGGRRRRSFLGRLLGGRARSRCRSHGFLGRRFLRRGFLRRCGSFGGHLLRRLLGGRGGRRRFDYSGRLGRPEPERRTLGIDEDADRTHVTDLFFLDDAPAT